MPSNAIIEFEHVSKAFEEKVVVKDLTLDIRSGEFVTLLGPSGSGKTTILRMVAGFEQPTAGNVIIDGVTMNTLPPYRRPINTVFQQYALFPHLNVFDNIAFGLRLKKLDKKVISDRVRDALKMVRMEAYETYRVKKLSGGQQQRVAIARAIVNQPKVLLLDEPLGALDLKLRREMQLELKRIHRDLGITFIYVTHDQEEAMVMSDRIGVVHEGDVVQFAPPEEVYVKPNTPFVANFIGETNLIEGRADDSANGEWLIHHRDFQFPVSKQKFSCEPGQTVQFSIRPESLRLVPLSESHVLQGTVVERVFIGSMVKTWVRVASGDTLQSLETGRMTNTFDIGEEVGVTWDSERLVMF